MIFAGRNLRRNRTTQPEAVRESTTAEENTMPTPTDYSAFKFDQSNDGSYATHGDAHSGEFTQVRPDSDISAGITVGLENGEAYPNIRGYGFDADNPFFSSDVDASPMALADETSNSMSNFADLQWFLMNHLETAGSRVVHDSSKPWTPLAGENK
jgi:hypothetical protein